MLSCSKLLQPPYRATLSCQELLQQIQQYEKSCTKLREAAPTATLIHAELLIVARDPLSLLTTTGAMTGAATGAVTMNHNKASHTANSHAAPLATATTASSVLSHRGCTTTTLSLVTIIHAAPAPAVPSHAELCQAVPINAEPCYCTSLNSPISLQRHPSLATYRGIH